MNEIIRAMITRRSIRKFKEDIPKQEDIEQIVEAGLYAPNGRRQQSAMVLAVTDRVVRDQLSDLNRRIGGWKGEYDPFYGAPVVLVVLANKQVPTYLYDGSLVMGNLLLAAHSLGLGGIWIHRAKEEFETDEMKNLLSEHGVTGEWEGIGNCAIGYIDGDVPEAEPRKDGRVVYI